MNMFADAVPGTSEYDIQDEVGHGAFSEVYKGIHKGNGNAVALKYMHLSSGGCLPLHVSREIDALKALNNPHIISYHGFHQQEYSVSLVLEYCNTDLLTVLKCRKGTPLPPALIKTIMFQLLSALDACHTSGLMHRDVGPSNILFNNPGCLKLADFGQCRSYGDANGALTPIVGTRWYKAPELLFGSRSYTPAIDIWAAGCIFAELVGGEPMFAGHSDIDQICKVFDKLGSLNEAVWPGVKDLKDWGKLAFPAREPLLFSQLLPQGEGPTIALIESMLQYNPDSRITAGQALQSAYFTSEDTSMLQHQEVAALLDTLLNQE